MSLDDKLSLEEKTKQLEEKWARLPELYRNSGWVKNEYEGVLLAIDPQHPKSEMMRRWRKNVEQASVSLEKRRVEWKKERIAREDAEKLRRLDEHRDKFDCVVGAHIRRKISTGEIIMSVPGNPRDLGAYLQSAEFMQFLNLLRQEFSRQITGERK